LFIVAASLGPSLLLVLSFAKYMEHAQYLPQELISTCGHVLKQIKKESPETSKSDQKYLWRTYPKNNGPGKGLVTQLSVLNLEQQIKPKLAVSSLTNEVHVCRLSVTVIISTVLKCQRERLNL
jgi:hypothetical protein